MYKISLPLSLNQVHDPGALRKECAAKAGIAESEISEVGFLKLSLDARPKVPCYQATMAVYTRSDNPHATRYDFSFKPRTGKPFNVVVAGMGPAGLFAALALASSGVNVVLLERGKSVDQRAKDTGLLGREGILNPDSNYGFGEGGAGCFSDGKLYTRSNKRGDIGRVLRTFVHFGADPEILYLAHPHLGSDRMPLIVQRMRKALLETGCEIHFNTRLTGILCREDGHLAAVCDANGNEYKADALVLATGHSAEDIYRYIHKSGWVLEEKPFALGVRLEHPQEVINRLQYKGAEKKYKLPPAEYGFAEESFSFCMCPGGVVIPACTEADGLVVNGMSNSGRSSVWANAGWVTPVNREILLQNGYKLGSGALALLDFRRNLEKKFYEAGVANGRFTAPCQRITDFVKQRESRSLPRTSYSRGVFAGQLQRLLPGYVAENLSRAFLTVERKKPGFLCPDAVLLGLESRTSSAVRIPRHADTLQSVSVPGVYPCGEGAGYAGGITSSAIDGFNCAEKILESTGLACNFANPVIEKK